MPKFFDTIGGKKVAFIGAGISHRELIGQFVQAGAQVTLCDKKLLADLGDYGEELMDLGVQLSLGESYLDGLFGKDMILRTPGFDFHNSALQQARHEGALVTSEMELFFEYCSCKKVGITGSDGKTTTASLIAAMYEAQGRITHLGGNIGRALLPIVDEIMPQDVAVVELSSFQLVSMQHSPDIAVVTNITPNHLDRHKNMEEYVGAKRNILAYQNEGSIAVLGADNELSRAMEADVKARLRFFSGERPVVDGAFLREDGMLCLAREGEVTPILHKNQIKLRGHHNILNVLAAFSAVRDDVGKDSMAKVAMTFEGVEHRQELVRKLDGVQWFNDSIATSPSSVVAGLRSYDEPVVLIAGGYDKKVAFDTLAPVILEKVKALILLGQTGPAIERAVTSAEGYEEGSPPILHARDMDEAVHMAQRAALPGDVVALSPASASFDMYENFEARGRHFKELVFRLEPQ